MLALSKRKTFVPNAFRSALAAWQLAEGRLGAVLDIDRGQGIYLLSRRLVVLACSITLARFATAVAVDYLGLGWLEAEGTLARFLGSSWRSDDTRGRQPKEVD